MQRLPRAGLVTLLFLCSLLIIAAHPLPIRLSASDIKPLPSSLPPSPRAPFSIASISSSTQQGNEIHQSSANIDLTSRERETVTLYRRKSIFTKIKDGFKKLGNGIKHAAQKIGNGIKTAAKKVGHFVKTTGAKIAKVGLKVWSTATKALSKVAQFIPVVGKPLSKAMDVAGTVANKASDAIHVKIGGKLGTAMNRMSKGQKVLNYIPREVAYGPRKREAQILDERQLYSVNMLLEARFIDTED